MKDVILHQWKGKTGSAFEAVEKTESAGWKRAEVPRELVNSLSLQGPKNKKMFRNQNEESAQNSHMVNFSLKEDGEIMT